MTSTGGIGPEIGKDTIDKGAEYSITDKVPYRADYDFIGWSADAGGASADRYHAGDELQVSHDMTFYAIWRPMVYVTFSGHGDYSDGFSYYNHSILYEEHPKDGYRLVSLIVYPVNNVYEPGFTFYDNEYMLCTSEGNYRISDLSTDFDRFAMGRDHENPLFVKIGDFCTMHVLYEIPRDARILGISGPDDSSRPYRIVTSFTG